jgi:hypothetical protein
MHIHRTNGLIIKRLAHAQAYKLHRIHQKPAAGGRANLHIRWLASSLHDSETRARDLGRAAERGVSQIERWKSEDVFYYNVNVCEYVSRCADDSVASARGDDPVARE